MVKYLVVKDGSELDNWIINNRPEYFTEPGIKFLHVYDKSGTENYFLSLYRNGNLGGKRVKKEDVIVEGEVIVLDELEDLIYCDLSLKMITSLMIYEATSIEIEPMAFIPINFVEVFPIEDEDMFVEAISVNFRAHKRSYIRKIYQHRREIMEKCIQNDLYEEDLKALGRLHCLCEDYVSKELAGESYRKIRNQREESIW